MLRCVWMFIYVWRNNWAFLIAGVREECVIILKEKKHFTFYVRVCIYVKSSSAGSELENERWPDVFRFNNRNHHTFRMPDLIALVNTLRKHANNPLMSEMLHVAHMDGVYYYVGWIYGLLCARARVHVPAHKSVQPCTAPFACTIYTI